MIRTRELLPVSIVNFSTDSKSFQAAIIALVLILHAVCLWIIGLKLNSQHMEASKRELDVTVFAPRLAPKGAPEPPLSWMFQAPDDVFVPEPQIDVQTGAPVPAGVPGNVIARRLMPRADPDHVNDRPQLPHTLGAWIQSASLEVLLLIRPDGTVAEAEIQRSTGIAEIDQLAISYIKGSWRYLPASVNGRPIETWTTAIVRFAAM